MQVNPSHTRLFFFTAAALTLFRLQFGVEFTDESYYLAQAYRFFLGDKPFVDDKLILSTMAFITEPLLALFHKCSGGVSGAILFFRLCYFSLTLVTALVCYRALRKYGEILALAVSSVPILYIHHQMPALSYNTMALHFWVIALFASLQSLIDGHYRVKSTTVSLIATLLMGIVYPPLSLAGFFFLVVLYVRTRPGLKDCVVPLLVAIAIITAFSFWIGFRFDAIAQVVSITRNAGGAGGLAKLVDCFASLWEFTPLKVGLALFILVFLFSTRIAPFPKLVLSLLIPILPMFLSKWVGRAPNGFAMHVLGYAYFWALMAPLFAVLDKEGRSLFWALFPLSFLAGIITAWSASYGLTPMGFVVGFFPATLLAIILFARWCGPNTIALFIVAGCLLYYQRLPFKDAPIHTLSTRVKAGPFWGLLTTKERAQDEERMREDIFRFATKEGKLFVFESMPVLYLYSTMRPLASVLYKTCTAGREACTEELKRSDNAHNLVIHVKPFRYNLDVLSSVENRLQKDDPLLAYVERNYRVVAENQHFRLFHETKSNSSSSD